MTATSSTNIADKTVISFPGPRFPRDIAQRVLWAKRYQEGHFENRGRDLKRDSIREMIRDLWKAWCSGDVNTMMTLVMDIQYIHCEYIEDHFNGELLEKAAEMERVARRKQTVTDDQIIIAVGESNWNLTEAAEKLGISRQAIKKRMTPEMKVRVRGWLES